MPIDCFPDEACSPPHGKEDNHDESAFRNETFEGVHLSLVCNGFGSATKPNWLGHFLNPSPTRLKDNTLTQSSKLSSPLGVYGEDDLKMAKAVFEKYRITWPSFRKKRDGPISKNWNVRSWPDIWVLDRHGVIRYRNVRGSDLNQAVDKLLRD